MQIRSTVVIATFRYHEFKLAGSHCVNRTVALDMTSY